MDPIVWPKTLLVPASVKLSLQSSSRGGGQTIGGNEQVATSPGSQRWAVTFGGLAIRTRDQVLAWRAIEAQADGRANAIMVPAYDWSRGPLKSPFVDSLAFGAAPFVPAVSAIVTAADAAVNDTSLSVTWTGPAPLPGQHFAVGYSLYRVRTISSSAAGAGTLTLRPWLRGGIPSGTPLNFDDPVCLVRLAKDDGLALDLNLWRFGSASVDFVEFT